MWGSQSPTQAPPAARHPKMCVSNSRVPPGPADLRLDSGAWFCTSRRAPRRSPPSAGAGRGVQQAGSAAPHPALVPSPGCPAFRPPRPDRENKPTGSLTGNAAPWCGLEPAADSRDISLCVLIKTTCAFVCFHRDCPRFTSPRRLGLPRSNYLPNILGVLQPPRPEAGSRACA